MSSWFLMMARRSCRPMTRDGCGCDDVSIIDGRAFDIIIITLYLQFNLMHQFIDLVCTTESNFFGENKFWESD